MKLMEVYWTILGNQQKIKVVLFFLCILINGILELLSVSLMLPLIAVILDSNAIQKFQSINGYLPVSFLQSREEFTMLLLLILFSVVVTKNIFVYLTKTYQRRFIVNGCYQTSSRLFNVYLHCDYEDFLNQNSNDIINNIVNLTNKIYLLLAAFLDLVAEIVVSILLLSFLLWVNWQVTVVLLLILIVLLFLFRRYASQKLKRIGEESNKVYANVIKRIQEAVRAYKEIRILGRERYFYDSFCDNYYQNVALEYQKAFYEIAPAHITEVVIFFVLCLYVWIAVVYNMNIDNVVAQLATVSLAAVRMIPAMNRINSNWNLINLYLPSLYKISDEFLLYATDDYVYTLSKNSSVVFKNSIELIGISYKYKNTPSCVLKDVNMKILKGQKVGISGVSGGGKTTLVDIILGYLKPQTGRILVDGVDISDNYSGWMQNIAYIPQVIFIMNGSIKENVLFGSNEDDESKIWKVLDQAQLSDYVKNLEHGINTLVGECGIKLSGGQRQRLGIARALYHEAEILVIDEATTSLDKETKEELMRAVNCLGRDRTILMVSHDKDILKICDVVYIVKDKGLEKMV